MTNFWIIFAGGLLLILLGVDLIIKLTGRKTLSHILHDLVYKFPPLGILFGAILGAVLWHLFVCHYS